MNCQQLITCLDDYLDGSLPQGERQLADAHLVECQACREEIRRAQALRQSLRNLAVPPPSADFQLQVRERLEKANKRGRAYWPVPAALAASMLVWGILSIFQPTNELGGVETIVMGIDDTRKVKLVFNAPADFDKVTLQLELSGNIELAGYSGHREIEWQSSLQKGVNTLVLPVNATGYGKAELIARIKHDGKTKIFRIPFRLDSPGAGRAALTINV